MDPITGMVLGQAAGSILGGLFGGDGGKGRQAAAMQQQALDILNNVPELSGYDREIVFQKLINGEPLTPQQEQAVSVGRSRVAQIQEDPSLQNTQKQALQMIKSVASSGMRPEDRAALNQIREQAQTDAEAKRQQILQSMQARGMGGSGAELAAALSASQAATQQQAQQSDQQAAQASMRALQAMSGMGSMAGQLRGQNFDVARATSGAEDAFKQFDTQNQIATQQRNVAGLNRAGEYNIDRANRVSDTNIGNVNQERNNQRQRMLQQAQYNADLAKAKANALTGQASNLYQQSAATKQANQQLGQGLGNLAGFGASKLMGGGAAASGGSSAGLNNFLDSEESMVPNSFLK